MDNKHVIGVDPGETTGIVRIEYKMIGESIESGGFWYPTGDPIVIQCPHTSVHAILTWLAAIGNVIISHERFVVSSRASRVKKAKASQITRDLNGWIDGLENERIRVVEHRAADVKPWAIPEKMVALRLDLSPEMRHARDAGAQAAYAGCHDLGAPDPLSKRVALAAAYGAEVAAQAGTYSYGIHVTKVGGEPVTDAVITFDTTPVDATVLGGQRVTSGPITGRLRENPPPQQYLPERRLGDPHPALKSTIDSQSGDQSRYIGLERFTEELEEGNE